MVRRFVAGAGLAALLIPAALGAGTAGASPPNPVDRFQETPRTGVISPKVLPVGADPSSRVKVMVQLTQPSVAEVTADRGVLSRGQQKKIERDLLRQQTGVVAAAKAKGGTVLAQTQYALNAVKIEIARKDIASLAQQPGVKAVLPVATYELDNATAVPFMGVPQVWQDTGFTGAKVKVAIIDTGIDYTHADFGGPGTVAAFEAADATDTTPANPDLFGPDAPRVKGGFDFVGDDYDASEAGSTPMPDPNPLDCNGHGTHVAGSAAGGGVNADGTSYTGPYDATVAGTDFQIGPGVAPQADLYALRVFGCAGSTDVTVEAIDWAVENGMDVINMSLGSPYGLKDDATALASSNAAAAGVVVVASAGNSGPNPPQPLLVRRSRRGRRRRSSGGHGLDRDLPGRRDPSVRHGEHPGDLRERRHPARRRQAHRGRPEGQSSDHRERGARVLEGGVHLQRHRRGPQPARGQAQPRSR